MSLEDSHNTLTPGQNKKFKKPFTCHYYHKPGHFKKDCQRYLAAQKKQASVAKKRKPPGSDRETFVTIHALAATSSGAWIIDLGATCHICNDKKFY